MGVVVVGHRVGEGLGSITAMPRRLLLVALAATLTRDRKNVVEFILTGRLARTALDRAGQLALSADEWNGLFGADAHARVSRSDVMSVAREANFLESVRALESALRFTLQEAAPKERWRSAGTRAACFIALHTEACEELVTLTLGTIVRSDIRRLDEVRSAAEERGGDELLLAKCIMAVSASYC